MNKPISQNKFNSIKQQLENGEVNKWIQYICNIGYAGVEKVKKSGTYTEYLKGV
jgi:hypothetical protein